MRFLPAAVLATVAVLASVQPRAAAPIRVMILDGESAGPYHSWPKTTPVLKQQLDETGLFRVDVVTAPPAGGSFNEFRPAFNKYQVVVLNYDAPDERWPAPLKTAFEQYMKNGGGLVVVHAADNAFPGWAAYNDLIGIGGWRDRTEKAGPFWYFKDGALASDATPGRAGSHGNRVPFRLTVRDSRHPIMRGLPPVWMHQADELYAALRGPGRNMEVLATAYSNPANNGTGRDEPQLMVLHYGKGRVFHTTLGHDVTALNSVDFAVTFQRGTEWAATGAVTQPVPSAFPGPDAVSVREDPEAVKLAATGQPIFAAQCGFCHGRDGMGGESGPDLTRAALVQADVHGDKIGPLLRTGRVDKGMPAFTLSEADLAATVAYIHDLKTRADLRVGARRAVDVEDLQTGNIAEGKQYFETACARCHSPSGDFAGLANRLQGLELVRRMLYPTPEAGAPRTSATVRVTLPSGEVVSGKLAYRDEFTIALTDARGAYRAWPSHRVKLSVDDPLEAHVAQLGKYTDADVHNVVAYLQTLR